MMADRITDAERALIDAHIATHGVTKVARGVTAFDPANPPDWRTITKGFYEGRARQNRLRRAALNGKRGDQ